MSEPDRNLTVDPGDAQPGGAPNAAQDPAGAVSADAAEPSPSVGHGEQTHSHPAGSAKPEGGIPATERPEALVGAAFAGGLVLALILKRLGR